MGSDDPLYHIVDDENFDAIYSQAIIDRKFPDSFDPFIYTNDIYGKNKTFAVEIRFTAQWEDCKFRTDADLASDKIDELKRIMYLINGLDPGSDDEEEEEVEDDDGGEVEVEPLVVDSDGDEEEGMEVNNIDEEAVSDDGSPASKKLKL